MTTSITDLPDRLRQALAARPRIMRAEWEARPAAVLVPLYLEDGRWNVLFTRRTNTVESHRGQVSFPGGQIESGDDDPAQAALREAEEEIGLRAVDVEILGQLSPLLTVTQFLISPVVGSIPWPYALRVNQREVASTFGVPLEWLADPANLELQVRKRMAAGPKVPVYLFRPYQEEVIWGATARITVELLDLLREEGLLG